MAAVALLYTCTGSRVPIADQSATPGRTTLLQAVNTMLMVIGEQPINSLDGQQINEASMAENTLLEFHREGQSRGWHWNRDEGFEFSRNNAGEIVVPPNIIHWSPDSFQFNGRYQLRGQRVYDRQNHTYAIGEASITADVTWALSWDECPEVFNRWVLVRAARVFAGRTLGDEGLVRLTGLDEVAARVELERAEMVHERPNSITGGPGMSPFPTFVAGAGLMGRRWGPRG